MRNLLRSILGILVVIVCIKVFALFVFLCYIGFFVPESPNPLESIEDKIEQIASLEADNATYELDIKINELKGRYKWLKSNMVE